MRTDKWKRYIILYDLHKAGKLPYSAIAEILGDLFPKEGGKSHAGNGKITLTSVFSSIDMKSKA